jgi:uncharacterized membrane protein (DUF373 family)
MTNEQPTSRAHRTQTEQRTQTSASKMPRNRLFSDDRGFVLSSFLGLAEDAVYALTALLLVGASVFALWSAAAVLVAGVFAHEAGIQPVLTALDQVLVVLIFVELFYTVRLSIREHILAVEPFIAVALIATVRRILVITAEERRVLDDPGLFQRVLLELGLLAGLVLVLVIALVLLARTHADRESAVRDSSR